jgi:predicted aspartyl protease
MSHFLKIQYARLAMLGVAALLMLSGCAPKAYLSDIKQLRFTTIGRIPVIEGKINGKRAYFIIDTGASCSILNQSVSERFGFKSFARDDEHVMALEGQAKMNHAFNCIVEVGPLRLKNVIFRTKCMDSFVNVIQTHENIEIAGIIGSDIFNRYGIAINFRSNTITF